MLVDRSPINFISLSFAMKMTEVERNDKLKFIGHPCCWTSGTPGSTVRVRKRPD